MLTVFSKAGSALENLYMIIFMSFGPFLWQRASNLPRGALFPGHMYLYGSLLGALSYLCAQTPYEAVFSKTQ